MTEKEIQREKDYQHGLRFKKKADIEYALYMKCKILNNIDEAKKHYSISQYLYSMHKKALHRAGYVIPS